MVKARKPTPKVRTTLYRSCLFISSPCPVISYSYPWLLSRATHARLLTCQPLLPTVHIQLALELNAYINSTLCFIFISIGLFCEMPADTVDACLLRAERSYDRYQAPLFCSNFTILTCVGVIFNPTSSIISSFRAPATRVPRSTLKCDALLSARTSFFLLAHLGIVC